MLHDDWMLEAPCQGSDDHFPSPSEGLEAVRVRRAKRVCLRCPHRRRCLIEAFRRVRPVVMVRMPDGSQSAELGEERTTPTGIWGGATEAERKAVAHLPMEERLRVLELWLRTQTRGPFAVAAREEVVA